MKEFDVVVVGGGPAGAVCASVVARTGRSVALVARPAPRAVFGEVLVAAAQPILRKAGLWPSFVSARHRPCDGILSAWGTAELATHDAIFSPHGRSFIIDRVRFDAMCAAHAADAGVQLVSDTVDRMDSDDRRCALTLRSGVSIQSEIVADARGRGAPAWPGTRVERADDLVGTSTTYTLPESSDDSHALIESVAEGWLYSIHLDPRRLCVVHFHDAKTEKPEAAFELAVTSSIHTRKRIARTSRHDVLRTRPACTAFIQRVPHMCVGIGDASYSLDPLCGTGLYHALASALDAGRAIAAGDLAGYVESERRNYSLQLEQRRVVYTQEQRWVSDFWRARQSDEWRRTA